MCQKIQKTGLIEVSEILRNWRMAIGDPYGMMCWFDPAVERLMLHTLTDEEKSVIVDMPSSVSGPEQSESHDGQTEIFSVGDHHGS